MGIFMSKLFLGITFAIILSLQLAQAEPTIAPKPQNAPVSVREQINEIITRKAFVYNVDPNILHAVIACESTYNPNAIGDGGHSRGLVQIYDDYHPTITHAQAFDPEFAINFLASEISKGNGHLWTCYRKISG